MSAAGSNLGGTTSFLGVNGGFGLGVGATSTPPPAVAGRVTQVAVETLMQASPGARVTQAAVEALLRMNPQVRVTQVAVEALVVQDAPMRLTQAALEVVFLGLSNVQITQAALEVVFQANSPMRLTQAAVEVVRKLEIHYVPIFLWLMERRTRTVPLSFIIRSLRVPLNFRLRRTYTRNVPLTIWLTDARPGWHISAFNIEMSLDPHGASYVSQYAIEVLIPNTRRIVRVYVIGA